MQPSTDQQLVSLQQDQPSLGETNQEHSFGEVVELPTPLTKKRRWVRCSQRPVFKRRRRAACLVLVLLLLLAVGVPLFSKNHVWIEREPVEQIVSPVVREVPEVIAENLAAEAETGEGPVLEGESSGEEVAEDEEGGMAVPSDPTLYLTIPRLGLYDHMVRNEDSEEALDLGAIKLPDTEFPWQKGDKNTYIACHRLGWPATESYNQCLNLPSIQEGNKIILKDANGTVYEYRVVETLTVEPEDNWVTDAVVGKDMVSLQTCIEAPDDLYTLGPNWSARFVVRAERVEERQAGGFQRIVEHSVAAHTGLHLHTLRIYSYYARVFEFAKSTRVLWGTGAR